MASTIKTLDASGVKILYDLLSLQDYPNNEVLAAVINAIDSTKMNKDNIFIGTKAEYRQIADTIPAGALVILTDVN